MWPFQKKQPKDEIDQKRLDTFGLVAIVSSQCIGPDRLPIMHGIRKHPNNVSDSGWRFSSGKESAAFFAEADNFKLVTLEMMIEADATLGALRDYPEGTEVTRLEVSESWRFIVADHVVDADGKVVGRLT